MKFVIHLFTMIVLASCNHGDSSRRMSEKLIHDETDAVTENTNQAHHYIAILSPVNSLQLPGISGTITITIEGDILAANSRVSGSAVNTVQAQNIHVGQLCPTEAADTNEDGYIDILESEIFAEKIIIPLDGQLESQHAGQGLYPLTDAWGAYVYSLTTSLTTLLDDLYSADEIEDDDLIKLRPGLPLSLEGKVVVLQGINDLTPLPISVATNNGLTPNQTLPVACGVFKKIDIVPGEIEEDDIVIGHVGNPQRPNNQIPNPSPNPKPPSGNSTSPNGDTHSQPTPGRPNDSRTSPHCPRGKSCLVEL